MFERKFLFFGIVFLALVLVSGCAQPSEAPSPAPAAGPTEPTEPSEPSPAAEPEPAAEEPTDVSLCEEFITKQKLEEILGFEADYELVFNVGDLDIQCDYETGVDRRIKIAVNRLSSVDVLEGGFELTKEYFKEHIVAENEIGSKSFRTSKSVLGSARQLILVFMDPESDASVTIFVFGTEDESVLESRLLEIAEEVEKNLK